MLESSDDGPVPAKAQAVAHQRPHHRDQRHQRKALHHDRQSVFPPHQPAIEQRQSRPGHHQHQRRAYQHPRVISGRLRFGHALVQLRQFFVDRRCGFRGCEGSGKRQRNGRGLRCGGSGRLLCEQRSNGEQDNAKHQDRPESTLPSHALHIYVRSAGSGFDCRNPPLCRTALYAPPPRLIV